MSYKQRVESTNKTGSRSSIVIAICLLSHFGAQSLAETGGGKAAAKPTDEKILCADSLRASATQGPLAAPSSSLNSESKMMGAKSEVLSMKNLSQREAWELTQRHFTALKGYYIGEHTEPVFFALMTAALAKEFVWINGGSGGAKTSMVSSFYKQVLLGLPYEQKKQFIIQFHKLLNENIITGTPIIKSALKGVFEKNYDASLVNETFRIVIGDEIDSANSALQMTLLALLNERQIFDGHSVVQSGLETGAFTSNKTLGELLLGYGTDVSSGEALIDRMGLKVHAFNQQTNKKATGATLRAIEAQQEMPELPLPIQPIRALLSKVVVPDSLLEDFADIGTLFDQYVIRKRERSLENQVNPENQESPYFPANQFSNRSWRKIYNLTVASFVAEQLTNGVPFNELRLTMGRQDLHHFATAAAQIGPGRLRAKSFVSSAKEVAVPFNQGQWKRFKLIWFPALNKIHLLETNGVGSIQLVLESSTQNYKLQSYKLQGRSMVQRTPEEWTSVVKEALQEVKDSQAYKDYLKNPVHFEVDPIFNDVLALSEIDSHTRHEIGSLKEDLEMLVSLMESQVAKPSSSGGERSQSMRQKRLQQLLLVRGNQQEFRIFNRQNRLQNNLESPNSLIHSKAPNADALAKIWEINQKTIREILGKFPETEHVVRGILFAMMNDLNVFMYGPPGGAKTALAKGMIDAELRTQNKLGIVNFINQFLKNFKGSHPKEFKLFMLQCHQMMSEGQIIGFQDIEAQLEREGALEYNMDTSLAAKNILYGIVDEIDKGHAAITATLLSLMEEREVYLGAKSVKATLLALVITSNKTPSELQEMFPPEDYKKMRAALDRALKVFVPNKFSQPETLKDYLVALGMNLKPKIDGPLMVNDLKTLVQGTKKEILSEDSEDLMEIALDIERVVTREQKNLMEASQKLHTYEPIENPLFYIPSHSGSLRSSRDLIKLWSSAKIVDQLIAGIPFDKVSASLTFKDLGLLASALNTSGPYKIESFYDKDGFLNFELDSKELDVLISGGRVSKRVQYSLENIKKEAEILVSALNQELRRFEIENREAIQQFPSLYPELVSQSHQGARQ